MLLEKAGERGRGKQTPCDDRPDEGVGERPPELVKHARQPRPRPPSAMAETRYITDGGDVRGEWAGAAGREQAEPERGGECGDKRGGLSETHDGYSAVICSWR